MIQQDSVIQVRVLERWTAGGRASCSGQPLPKISPPPCTAPVRRGTPCFRDYPCSSRPHTLLCLCCPYAVCSLNYTGFLLLKIWNNANTPLRWLLKKKNETTLTAVFSSFNFFPETNCRQPMSAAKLKQTSLSEPKVLSLETQTHSLTPQLTDCRFFNLLGNAIWQFVEEDWVLFIHIYKWRLHAVTPATQMHNRSSSFEEKQSGFGARY